MAPTTRIMTHADPTSYLTPVGDFEDSPGPFGTYDMAGDVWQWNETSIYLVASSEWLRARGGSFVYGSSDLASSFRDGYDPTVQIARPDSAWQVSPSPAASRCWLRPCWRLESGNIAGRDPLFLLPFTPRKFSEGASKSGAIQGWLFFALPALAKSGISRQMCAILEFSPAPLCRDGVVECANLDYGGKAVVVERE